MSEAEQPPLQVAALAWGVKESFRRYVEATGAIETIGAASRGADGSFIFPVATNSTLRVGADGVLRGQAAFSGEILFKAHGGALNVRLTDPVLEIGEKASVFVVAQSGGRTRRAEFAQLNLAGATRGSDEIVLPAKLDWDGSELLDNHYPAATPIDPVRLMLDATTK
jgi:hypothetical protein